MLASEIPIPRASLRSRTDGDIVDDRSASARAKLSKQKSRVPGVQERIGQRRWRHLVNAPSVMERMNQGRGVINRAYHKLHEMVMSCALSPVTTSVHLCEAPGGFVQCTFDHLRTGPDWTWRAVTLQDGVPVSSESAMFQHGNFLFADVLTQNEYVITTLRETFPNGVELVTADGATAMQHDHIEQEHYPLALAQTRISLHCLSKNGTFVLKLFECLHPCTRDLIARLTQCFDSVSLMKPGSSRPTNSERYLVCRSFDGCTRNLEELECVHAEGWMVEYTNIVDGLARRQQSALETIFASV